MVIVPVTLVEAKRFVGLHHRHNKPPVGWMFGCGLSVHGKLVGVAIVGRPVARALDNTGSVEVTRVCTIGTRNANSMLYGAVLRAATALGYERAYTYTLQSESGSTLRAVGFAVDAQLPERKTWSCKSRHRVQVDLFGNQTRPTEPKLRWLKVLNMKGKSCKNDDV